MAARSRSRRLLLTLLVAWAGSAVALTGGTLAVLTDVNPVPGNSLTTSACFRAEVEAVQKGTTAITANGTTAVAIAPVNPGTTYLLFSARSSSDRPVGSTVRGRLASAGSLEFVRVTDELIPATITVSWNVVEYTCGVLVRRGDTTISATTVNVPLTPALGSLARSFVRFSKTPMANKPEWAEDDAVLAALTTTENLQFRVNSASSHVVSWEVVEFLSATDAAAQRGTTSLTGTNLTATVTLPSTVDTGRTIVLVSFRTAGAGQDIGARLLRARLTGATSLVIDREVSGSPDDITEIAWQVVEFGDGTHVERGSAAFGLAAGQVTATIAPVDTTRAVALGTVDGGAGESMGKSGYVLGDVIGVTSATMTLSSATTVTLDRASILASADIGWQVIEFAAGCGRAKTLQHGTTTVNVNGATAIPVSTVAPTSAVLLFSLRSDSNRPVASTVRGRLASATSIEFVRVTDEASPAPIVVSWDLVEFTCGVRVQRGDTALSAAGTTNVAISAVASTSQAFVLFSKGTAAADASWDANDPTAAELTGTSNVQFRNEGSSTHTVSWQVVEYLSSFDLAVQKGSTSLTGSATSVAVTLPVPVDVGRSFVVASLRSTGTGSDIGARMVRARLTDTTVTVDRAVVGSPDDLSEVFWQVVEFKDGTLVQHGSAAFGAGTGEVVVPITAVDPRYAVAVASTDGGAGQSMGRTTLTTDDVPGAGQATMAISSAATLTATRGNTAAAADIAWFVLQFGSP